MNEKHPDRTMTCRQCGQQFNHGVEKPWRPPAYLAYAVQVQIIAIPRMIDEGITAGAVSEKGCQLSGVQVVDFETVADLCIRRASSAVGRNQHYRHLTFTIRHPAGQGRQKVKGPV